MIKLTLYDEIPDIQVGDILMIKEIDGFCIILEKVKFPATIELDQDAFREYMEKNK